MGLRGPHAKTEANQPRPDDELTITDDALRIYKRMRRLGLQCSCPDEVKLGPDGMEWCPACAECWRLNGKLCEGFHIPPWVFAYDNPDNPSWRPTAEAIARFRALEAALKQANKKRTRKCKWER
jgi:hypothetical protein